MSKPSSPKSGGSWRLSNGISLVPSYLFHKSVNLDLLYPPFLEALLNLLMECHLKGSSYKVYSGSRSFDEQTELYEKHLQGGPRAAPAGLSAHNYGLAIDCARLVAGKLSWDSADYKMLEETVSKHGLITGAPFNDRPHVQWPAYVNARQLLPLKALHASVQGDAADKLKAVWSFLDSGAKP